jgi:hypothetical protein
MGRDEEVEEKAIDDILASVVVARQAYENSVLRESASVLNIAAVS